MTQEELEVICEAIPPIHTNVYEAVMGHWDSVAKPIDGLGDMERMLARIGSIQGVQAPKTDDRSLLVFLSDNGIVDEGVSQCGSEVTHAVAEAMGENGSTVCIMAKRAGVNVVPVDIGMKGEPVEGLIYSRIREGTNNFYKEPAMSREEALEAIGIGYAEAHKIVEKGCDLLLLGEMGIGNTSTATDLSCALLGLSPACFVGHGAGLSDEFFAHKVQVLDEALKKHSFDKNDIIEVLSIFGGFDIAGMVGAILCCAMHNVPVILDGLITLSAALVAERLSPGVREYCIASHDPREPMGKRLLSELSYTAPINAGLALGEGTGAVLLVPLLDVCNDLYRYGRRFEGIGIEAYERFN